jgi:hypothetical protein
VELCGANDPGGKRAGERRALVRDLRHVVARAEPVAAHDRDDDEALDADGGSDRVEVPRRLREELGCGALLGRRPGRAVDQDPSAR